MTSYPSSTTNLGLMKLWQLWLMWYVATSRRYVDKRGDFRCEAIHHDGTNHYLYRTFKKGVSDYQIENFKDKLYRGTATRADITRLTMRLGDEIGKVYGWTFPQKHKQEIFER